MHAHASCYGNEGLALTARFYSEMKDSLEKQEDKPEFFFHKLLFSLSLLVHGESFSVSRFAYFQKVEKE